MTTKAHSTKLESKSIYIMLGLILAIFIPYFFTSRTAVDHPYVLDIGYQWIGFHEFIRAAFQGLQFPLWNPHDLCGSPFLAFSHTGVLYPLGAIFALFGSFTGTSTWRIALHLVLACLLMYRLLRELDRPPAVAALGGGTYALSGFLFANINFPPTLHVCAWLPLLFLGTHMILTARGKRGIFNFSLALCMMILAGDIETVIYAMMGVGYYVLIAQPEKQRSRVSALAVLVIAAVAALLVALPQFLPLVELNHLSIRGLENYSPGLDVNPWMAGVLLLMLFPVFMPPGVHPPNSGLDPWYLGVLLVPFFFLALVRYKSSRRQAGFFVFTLVYLIIMYVPPFSRMGEMIPVLHKLIVPLRMFIVIEVFFIIIATKGLADWLGSSSLKDRFDKGLTCYWVVYATACFISLFFFPQARLTRAALGMVLIASPLVMKKLKTFSMETRISRATAYIGLIFLLDIYGLAAFLIPRTNPAEFEPEPAAVLAVAGTSAQSRYAIISIKGVIDPGLPFHLGLREDADSIFSWTRSPLARTSQVISLIYPDTIRRDNDRITAYDQMAVRNPSGMDARGLGLFNLMGVEYFISRYAWQPESSALEVTADNSSDGNVYIYESQSAMPRAWIVHQCERLEQPRDRLLGLLDPAFDPTHSVILARGVPEHGFHDTGLDTLSFERPRSDVIKFSAELGSPGWLVWSESRVPGWEMEINGRPEKIVEGNYALSAVFLDKGRQQGRMVYRPLSFRVGLWAGLAALFSAFALMLYSRFLITPTESATG